MKVKLLVTLDVSDETDPEEARDLFDEIATQAVEENDRFETFFVGMEVDKVELCE